jgi:stage V sporulation protein B
VDEVGAGSGPGDRRIILAGTGQNLVGLAVYVLATFGTNVLISRSFGSNGASALGSVTLATQFAFIAGAATRFGMDHAAVRRVAIDVGKGEAGRARAVVARAVGIALAVSVVVGAVVFAGAGRLASAFSLGRGGTRAFQAVAVAIPFAALCQVYLGGTRGLKIMRHTLSIFWVGQPVAWIALMVAGWVVSKSVGMTVFAYALSWMVATALAWFVWVRETSRFAPIPAPPDEVRQLVRFGLPRAPAAVLSQLLFWTDYFVFSRYARGPELGVYAAAVRVAQVLILFLTAVNYMFSPFVADLHERGEREQLDSLYKALTRWVVAGTIPLLLVLMIASGPVLRIFGGQFAGGTAALRILLIGQCINVAVGSVGFILIMVGQTGRDLVVYALSFLLDLVVAFVLAPRMGAEGAAIAQAATLAFSNGARLWLVWRYVRIQPFDRHYLRLLGPAAASAAVMLTVHAALANGSWPVDLVGTGLAGGVVYLVGLMRFGLTPQERVAAGVLVRRLRTGRPGRPA